MDQRDGWNSQGGLRLASQELQEASQEMPGLHANRKVKEEGIERRSGLEGAQGPAGTTLLRVTSHVPAPAYGWYWDRAPVQKQSELPTGCRGGVAPSWMARPKSASFTPLPLPPTNYSQLS